MKKTLNVTWLGEQRYLGVSESGHQLLIDNSAVKVGVSPMEALLGALATCTAYDVVEIMQKRRTPLSRYRIEVEGERAETTPKRYTHITVRHIASGPGITEEALHRAAHLSHEKYCSVAASMNSEIVVETRVETEETAPPA
ncbi:OsmC family protein [Deinococcus multiflagellatus]|uniref:OsmC family protein n=1 Tax=Deinococcus multiflagellatus TaxID=1656887 RepID=UPI001CCFB6B8|nr:OsmC family protein [Deinococcus multiflagellatus]MBZ9713030.1 OsmC family protein [Deinococcus multiflagellatus]